MEKISDIEQRIQAAMGETPADTVFVNGNIVSTFTEEIWQTEVAVTNGRIVALGKGLKGKEVIDLKEQYLSPSFIDAHIHVESSMLSPEGFASVVVPRGTGAVVSDPHEIANVLGISGYEYMLKASHDLPMDIHLSIPSCVPATHMETSGAIITAEDFEKIYSLNPQTPALSELMNYPGVYYRNPDVIKKIVTAQKLGLAIDGHSPMLKGTMLNGYLNAGIFTDHECTTAEEAIEKLRKGMFVLIREGSAARNLEALLPVLNDKTAHRMCICSDDRHPDQLLEQGHLDYILRMLIAGGVDPLRAIRIMTLNPAQVYSLNNVGGIGISYWANFAIFDNLQNPHISTVYFKGKKVAESGKILAHIDKKDASSTYNSVSIPKDLTTKLNEYPQMGKVNVIGILPGELITEKLVFDLADFEKENLSFLAVVERHGKNGNVGLGYVKGMDMKSGALASTVAHDNHNLILVGKNKQDMIVAAEMAQKQGGGFVVVNNGNVLASVSLPIAGLMSDANVHDIVAHLKNLEKEAKNLGISLESPFMVLSFLALAVIPHLKLTDHGLVDVDKFELISLEEK